MFWKLRGWERPKMGPKEALAEIQRMHETQTVRRESIVGWYRWHEGRLPGEFPSMDPERSEGDLIMVAAMWMTLTDVGGKPGFPYEYASALNLSATPAAPNPSAVDRPEIRPLIQRVQQWSAERAGPLVGAS